MTVMEKTDIKPNIGITQENREAVIKILNKLLADEHVLYIKTRNYHWHIVGAQFNDLHRFFEEQYTELTEMIDEVAERVRTLGGSAIATMTEFLEHARLEEHPGSHPDTNHILLNLLDDHELIIRHLREELELCHQEYGDMGTSDFLTGLMEKHEKMAWMLRAFLES